MIVASTVLWIRSVFPTADSVPVNLTMPDSSAIDAHQDFMTFRLVLVSMQGFCAIDHVLSAHFARDSGCCIVPVLDFVFAQSCRICGHL